MILLPVLNPPPYAKGLNVKIKRNSAAKPWASVAPVVDGKILSKQAAMLAGIEVRGHVSAREIRQLTGKAPLKSKKGGFRKAGLTSAQEAAARAAQDQYERRVEAEAAMAKAEKKAATARKRQRTLDKKKDSAAVKAAKARAKKGYTRGRSYKKGTAYGEGGKSGGDKAKTARPETIKYTEAAYQSGAVVPASRPGGGKLKGAGRAMTFAQALEYQRPVVGFLSRNMIKGYYERLLKGGAKTPASSRAAQDYLDTMRFGGIKLKDGTYVPHYTQKLSGKHKGKKKSNEAAIKRAVRKVKAKGVTVVKGLEAVRRERGSAWTRIPRTYPRSGFGPGGKTYTKGQRIPDYTQRWSDKPSAWQRTPGTGPHLDVRFRRGRGPYAALRTYRGFSPHQDEVDLIEQGGFGGPLDSPGGVVKLNRGRRRKNPSRRRKAVLKKNPARNKRGRFVKKHKAKKNPRRRRRVRKNKPARMKVYNNKRKRKKAKKNPGLGRRRRRRGRGRKAGHAIAAAMNPRRRRRRKNPGHGRRRKYSVLKNPLQAQIEAVKKQAFWLQVAHGLVGMTGTAMLSNALMGMGPLRRLAYGQGIGSKVGRFAVQLGSAGLVSAGAYMLRDTKVVGPMGWKNVLVGGAIYASANLLNDLFRSAFVPSINVGAPAPAADMADWFELSGMGGGMGSVESPYDLVAGESAARMSNEFAGLGSSGGYAIPLEDLRGYPGQYGGGMSDWVEFSDQSAVSRDALALKGESF